MNRKKLLLAILLVVLALSIVVSIFRMPKQKTVEKLKNVPGVAAEARRGQITAPQDDTKLHLALLDKEIPRFSGYRRNIFQPIFHEVIKSLPPPPPAPNTKLSLPVPPPQPMSTAPPPPQTAEPTPLQREMAKFTFLGFLKKDNKKTIFLSSNNEIFVVKKGDKIVGKYEVANITDEALTISLLQDSGEIVIPLVENKALSAPRK